MPDPVPHMSSETFRRVGHELVDWVASYLETVGERRITPGVEPGEVAGKVPFSPPEKGEGDWDAIVGDLDRVILPGMTHWQHPGFFGYFPCNASGPAILAELVSAGLGAQGMLWSTGPAVTELETRMLDWLAEAFGLPACFRSDADNHGRLGGGVIQGTASEGALAALVAGRDRCRRALAGARPAPDHNAPDPVFTCYTSEQSHSSIVKAAMVASVARSADDRERVRLVPTDDQLRMDAGALASMMREDVARGRVPAFVAATLGTTGTGAFDPVRAIAEAVRAQAHPEAGSPWLHVDAAWSGAALVCPEHRGMLDGVEQADSLCVNPHKWLLTNFDCDLFWTRDRRSLTGAMSITPEYLRNAASEGGRVIDYRDWHVPLGRRFRALKLWFVVRHYGLAGLRAHIAAHVDLAAKLEARLHADERFELPLPRSLSLVTFRCRAGDDATRALLERINATGEAFLTHTVAPTPERDGTRRASYLARVAIGGTQTDARAAERLWTLIDTHAPRAETTA